MRKGLLAVGVLALLVAGYVGCAGITGTTEEGQPSVTAEMLEGAEAPSQQKGAEGDVEVAGGVEGGMVETRTGMAATAGIATTDRLAELKKLWATEGAIVGALRAANLGVTDAAAAVVVSNELVGWSGRAVKGGALFMLPVATANFLAEEYDYSYSVEKPLIGAYGFAPKDNVTFLVLSSVVALTEEQLRMVASEAGFDTYSVKRLLEPDMVADTKLGRAYADLGWGKGVYVYFFAAGDFNQDVFDGWAGLFADEFSVFMARSVYWKPVAILEMLFGGGSTQVLARYVGSPVAFFAFDGDRWPAALAHYYVGTETGKVRFGFFSAGTGAGKEAGNEVAQYFYVFKEVGKGFDILYKMFAEYNLDYAGVRAGFERSLERLLGVKTFTQGIKTERLLQEGTRMEQY